MQCRGAVTSVVLYLAFYGLRLDIKWTLWFIFSVGLSEVSLETSFEDTKKVVPTLDDSGQPHSMAITSCCNPISYSGPHWYSLSYIVADGHNHMGSRTYKSRTLYSMYMNMLSKLKLPDVPAYNNITRHTVHAVASGHNHKQWLRIHISYNKIYTHFHNHHKRNRSTGTPPPTYITWRITERIGLIYNYWLRVWQKQLLWKESQIAKFMGPTWAPLSAPDGPRVGSNNLAIRGGTTKMSSLYVMQYYC